MANVDIAATLYGLAGGNPEADTPWDGRPIGRLFGLGGGVGGIDAGPGSTPAWRDALLVEYWSLGTVLRGAPTSEKCNPTEQVCLDSTSECMCDVRIHEEDGPGNTYIGLRLNNATHDLLYARPALAPAWCLLCTSPSSHGHRAHVAASVRMHQVR